jgi:RNA polymerase sigma-70 factor (ECF subfamily)
MTKGSWADLMNKSDQSLIDAHLQGDCEAFGELVRRYGGSLLGYLTKMSGSREHAEDLFQETFRRVHEKAHTFRGGNFKSWLYSIATRVAIDNLRRGRRLRMISLSQVVDCDDDCEKEIGAVIVLDSAINPSAEVAKAEQIQQVRQAVEMLPAKQLATLVLAYYQQLSYSEVAQVMGCSVGTVKTQMYRALKTLAQRLPDIAE